MNWCGILVAVIDFFNTSPYAYSEGALANYTFSFIAGHGRLRVSWLAGQGLRAETCGSETPAGGKPAG